MYILVKTENKEYLFESIEEMDEGMRLNNLYPKVKSISEIDREQFNRILRETASGLRDKKDLNTQAREMESRMTRKLDAISTNGSWFQRWLSDFNYRNTMRAISKNNFRYKK